MTEQKAIEGCKKHDRISQKFIFDAYSDGMLMVCLRYVKNLPDAEELMQNGFYNFFRTIDRFIYSGQGSIGGWMKKIMVNECLMFLRKKEKDFLYIILYQSYLRAMDLFYHPHQYLLCNHLEKRKREERVFSILFRIW